MKKLLVFLLALALSATAMGQAVFPLGRKVPTSRTTKKHTFLSKSPIEGIIKKLILSKAAANSRTFTLTDTSYVSFGAFIGDSLIKTIGSNVRLNPGTYRADTLWDGLDEDSVEVANGTRYQIGILYGNVTAKFEGTVGNTSDQLGGTTTWHSGEHFTSGVSPPGLYNYFAVGYNENEPGHLKALKSNPQSRINVISTEGMVVRYMDYDSTRIYWIGQDHNEDTGLIATNRSNDAQATLAGGTAHTFQQTAYSSMVAFTTTDIYMGLAVQRNGNYYFISDSINNVVRSYHKTLSSVQSFAITKPGDGVCDAAGDLWLITNGVVNKYSVHGNGVINTTPVLSLTGLSNPKAIDLHPDGRIVIVDGGTRHQVRFFNATTGVEETPLGQLGGYANTPLVSNDRFYFGYTKTIHKPVQGYGSAIPWLMFSPDSTLYVGDVGNFRTLVFSKNLTYRNTIQHLGYTYSAAVNQTDSSQVFAGLLEFRIDYSKPLLPNNGSWVLYRNWAAKMYQDYDDQHTRMKNVTTLSNGRTYAWARHTSVGKFQCIELTSTGLRYTGFETADLNYRMMADGSLWRWNSYAVGSPAVISKQLLTGFDGSGNPTWGISTTVVSSPPVTRDDGIANGGGHKSFGVTASGLVYMWNSERYGPTSGRGNRWHLNGIRSSAKGWAFKTAKATYQGRYPNSFDEIGYRGNYPDDGSFDIGNSVNVPGSFSQPFGRFIFYGYNGENWKAGQVNKHTIWHDSGLLVTVFGFTHIDAKIAGITEAFPGMEGNANNGGIAKSGSNYYLYHGGEFHRGGVSRWEVIGLESVKFIKRSFVKTGKLTFSAKPYTDLMAGLPRSGDSLVNNTAGWERLPVNGNWNEITRKGTKILVRRVTHKVNENDIIGEHRPTSSNTTVLVQRSISGISDSTYVFAGEIVYPEASENGGVNEFRLLDSGGKIIAKIGRTQVSSTASIQGNGITFTGASGNLNQFSFVYTQKQPVTFRVSGPGGTTVTIRYGNYPPIKTTRFDPTADATRPGMIQQYLTSPGTQGKQFAIANWKLYLNP